MKNLALKTRVWIWAFVAAVPVLAIGQEVDDESTKTFLKADLTVSQVPAGLPSFDIGELADPDVVELGRKLFFDRLLSVDHSTSCATCHQPQYAFSAPEAIVKGVENRMGRRNPPVIINRQFGQAQFWDGRVATLEHQALEPIKNELELANSVEEVLKRLREHDEYKTAFANLFDDGVTETNLAAAIASFERALLSGDSRIDRFVTAQKSSLSKSERQGLWLYESKGGCWQCHTGKTYSDEKFHNTGVSWGVEPLDLGRFEITGTEEHKGQFKTPTLRDVELSGPYMHDGSIKSLREVVEFYNRGGNQGPFLDPKIKPLNLSESEIDDLVAFLRALTGRHAWDIPKADDVPGGDQPKQ